MVSERARPPLNSVKQKHNVSVFLFVFAYLIICNNKKLNICGLMRCFGNCPGAPLGGQFILFLDMCICFNVYLLFY